jgi:hypothetical protein
VCLQDTEQSDYAQSTDCVPCTSKKIHSIILEFCQANKSLPLTPSSSSSEHGNARILEASSIDRKPLLTSATQVKMNFFMNTILSLYKNWLLCQKMRFNVYLCTVNTSHLFCLFALQWIQLKSRTSSSLKFLFELVYSETSGQNSTNVLQCSVCKCPVAATAVIQTAGYQVQSHRTTDFASEGARCRIICQGCD